MHLLEICVFLGCVLRILWSEVTNNFGVPEIRVFLGLILRIFWSEVMNNFAVPKIHVVGELSCWGHNWNIIAEFCSLLLLERCEIRVKKYTFWAILRCVVGTLSNVVRAGEQVKKCTCNDSFS